MSMSVNESCKIRILMRMYLLSTDFSETRREIAVPDLAPPRVHRYDLKEGYVGRRRTSSNENEVTCRCFSLGTNISVDSKTIGSSLKRRIPVGRKETKLARETNET